MQFQHWFELQDTSKSDEFMNDMEKMNENITKCNEKFEKFMIDKSDSDLIMLQDIKLLKNDDKTLEINQVQHELKSKRHENILTKLLLSIFDEMSKVILSLNLD